MGLLVIQSRTFILNEVEDRPLSHLETVQLRSDPILWKSLKCKKDFPAVTICNQNQMKRSSVLGTRFEPLLKIDDQIQADQAQFQAIKVRKRRQISGTPSSGD